MTFQRFSILCVILPSEHDGFEIPHRHPLLSTGLFAWELRRVLYLSSNFNWCKVIKNYHRPQIWLGFFVMCSSSGRRQMPQEQKINPSGMCFQQDWHWPALVNLSQPVQCNIAKFVNCSTRLFAELDGFFLLGPNLQQLILHGIHFVIFHHSFEFDPFLSSSFGITFCAIP